MEERIKVLLHKDLLRSLGTCSFYYTVMLACGCRKNGCLESPSLVFLDGHKQLKRILLLARLPGKSFNACRPHILFPVPDPDLEIRGPGGWSCRLLDKRGPGLQKKFCSALRALVWSKIRGGRGDLLLDPPLLSTL